MEISSRKSDVRTQKRSELGQFRNLLPCRWSLKCTVGTHHSLNQDVNPFFLTSTQRLEVGGHKLSKSD